MRNPRIVILNSLVFVGSRTSTSYALCEQGNESGGTRRFRPWEALITDSATRARQGHRCVDLRKYEHAAQASEFACRACSLGSGTHSLALRARMRNKNLA